MLILPQAARHQIEEHEEAQEDDKYLRIGKGYIGQAVYAFSGFGNYIMDR